MHGHLNKNAIHNPAVPAASATGLLSDSASIASAAAASCPASSFVDSSDANSAEPAAVAASVGGVSCTQTAIAAGSFSCTLGQLRAGNHYAALYVPGKGNAWFTDSRIYTSQLEVTALPFTSIDHVMHARITTNVTSPNAYR